jgi:phosphatidylinositol alpha-1,6-mannosyltransferase
MTTLLVTNVFPPKAGGSGRWFWELYRRLPREEVVIAAGDHPGHAEFDRGHDLRVVRMPIGLPSWGIAGLRPLAGYWGLVRRLRAVCRQYKVDTIHAGCILPEGFAAWLLKRFTGIKYLLFVHGEEMRVAGGSRELTWMARRVLAGAERIIANSHNTARILREEWNVAEKRITVLHPGVDTERFCPAPRDLAVRERLGWGERPVVLTVGRLQKRKGHDMLIRALPAIREAVPDVLYSIVGDGEERQPLESLVWELGLASHVQFRGEPADDELVQCYQQCDLFALPNREVNGDIEGFGMVLVEAQACGKPVIAGDSGGTAETLQPGVTGKVVNCEEPVPLAAAIGRSLSHVDGSSVDEHSRTWVATKFAWSQLAGEFQRQVLKIPNASSPSLLLAPIAESACR